MGTYTKNPLIVKVLSHLSWVEDLGSGKRNIKKYAPLYFPGYKVGIKSGQQFEFSITYQDLTGQVTGQVGQLLNIIGNDMLSTSEMMSRLGLKDRDNFRISYLAPALKMGLIARTDEINPKNPHQKYFLTELGKNQIGR